MIGLPAQLSPIQRIPPSPLPPFNHPPQSKSHSSLFAHSFEWRETVVEKETDICACFPDPSPPLSPSLAKSEWFTLGVKSGGKPGGRERKRERGKQRGKDLEGRRNSDGLLDSFHSPSISRVTFMTAERAAFEGIRITKERTMATRGGGRIKPAPPL